MGFRYARDVGKRRWSVALSLVVLAGVSPGDMVATLEIEASSMSANGHGFPVHYPRLRRVGTPVRLA
jgi:hypothetical protein